MKFSWKSAAQNGKIVALAPMDGYSDSAFRQVAKIVEPRTIVFCEFVSADGLSRAPQKMARLVQFNANTERPYIVQMFGKNPAAFAEAAKFLEDFGVDGIDINYGCPARKVVGSGHGSSLIRTPDLAAECLAAVKKTVSIPVSAKTRLGWSDDSTLHSFAHKLISAGAEMLTIHGRTVNQQFSGSANWNSIYELKKAFPETIILGNGDITSGEIATEKIGNLDGVMIGRASFGNPWIFREVANALFGEGFSPPNSEEKATIIRKHAELLLETKGHSGILEFRKHLLSFTKGFAGAREMRREMTAIENLDDVEKVIAKMRGGDFAEKISEKEEE